MCEKFKRKMLQHYLIYLLRSFKEDLKRITVQSNSLNNNNDNTPADQDRNNKDSEAKISRSNTKKRSSNNTFKPISEQNHQHSKISNLAAAKALPSKIGAPLPKRQKLDSVGNTPNTSPNYTNNNPKSNPENRSAGVLASLKREKYLNGLREKTNNTSSLIQVNGDNINHKNSNGGADNRHSHKSSFIGEL